MTGPQPHLLAAIQALEAQRALLGDAPVDAAVAALRAQLQPEPPAREPLVAFTGERKLVTVMFADISGFTALSERLDAEEVRALMNDCFDQLVPVIQKYEGTIDKFIGDEIMALFGAPRAHEHHAEMACRAALDLMEALRAFNHKNGTSLQLHIGLNTGLVIAGGLGSEGRQQYSVMGDAVNLAARLKDAARPGEIFAGSDTYALAGHQFEFFALPPMRLKGKAEVVQVHNLYKVKTGVDSGWSGRMRSDLVGRIDELAALQALVARLAAGRGGCLALIGEAGIGKSRLVAEIRREAADSVTWIEGRTLAYTRQNSYQPAVEILRKLIAAPPELSEEGMQQRLREELTALFPDDPLRHYPYLGSLLQLPLKEEEQQAIRFLSAERLRERIHLAFRQYLEAKSSQRPLVLVWEDLHWADPSSLLLIEHLLDLGGHDPILFLLMFRPRTEERIWQLHLAAQKKYAESYQTLQLPALTHVCSTALACNLLRIERLAPEVERMVYEKAEGNPFFIEELLRSLLDNGLLFLEQFEIQARGDLSGLNLPTTLQGVIASRIDQLPATDKIVLQVASVLGRFFRPYILQLLLEKVDPAIQPQEALTNLVHRELLRLRMPEQPGIDDHEYVFKHAVTHEVTYQGLLLADRRRLHRLAGETIEEQAGDARDEFAGTLAMHFENANDRARAVHYLRLAAGRAQSLFANEEALAFYQRAITQTQELLAQHPSSASWSSTLAGLLENQADILRITGQYEEALIQYRKAQQHHEENNWIAKSRLERKMGLAHNAHSHFDQMLEHFNQARSFLLRSDPERSAPWWKEWLDVHIEQTMLHYWMDQPEQMKAIAEQIQPALDTHGTPSQRAIFLGYFLGMNFRLERFLLSDGTIQKAWELYEIGQQIEDLRPRSFNNFMVGFALIWHNNLEDARRILEEGLPMTEQTGDIVIRSRYLTYLTVIARRQGQVEETETMARRSMAVAQKAQMEEYVGTAYANLAWCAWKQGDLAQAETFGCLAFEGWKKLHQTHASLVFVWTASWPLVASYFQRGNLAACFQQLEEILHPRSKRMDPELEEHLEQLLQNDRGGSEETVRKGLKKALRLAEKYHYL